MCSQRCYQREHLKSVHTMLAQSQLMALCMGIKGTFIMIADQPEDLLIEGHFHCLPLEILFKVIQIMRVINCQRESIFERLHQMQVMHKWWILSGVKDPKKMLFELRKKN